MLSYLKSLLGSRYPKMVLRIGGALVCFVIAFILAFIPGPAIPFWILGFILLGYGAAEILFSFKKVQDWLHRHVPFVDRLPRFKRHHMRAILRHPWVHRFDQLSSSRKRRHHRREKRRAELRKKKAEQIEQQ